MPVVWCYKGEFAGKIIDVATQADADRAEAEGWGQDMAKYSGHQLIEHVLDPPEPPPEMNNELPAPEATAADDPDTEKDGGEYKTRHLEAEPPRRGRPPKRQE